MPLDMTTAVSMIARHGFATPAQDFGLRESETIFPIGERTLASVTPTETGHDVRSVSATHKAICRLDTDEIVGVVSSSYKPLLNAEFYGTVEEALRQAIPDEMFEGVQVRDRISHGGAWSQREYVLPRYSEELKGTKHSTRVGLRIVAWNSYDGSASAGLMTGLIDFYCTNGMVIGHDISRELRRHSTGLTPNHFLPRLRKNLEGIHEEINTVRRMANTPLNSDLALAFLEKHLSGQRAAEMWARTQVEAEVRGDNVFALHSALTNYASHDSRSFWTRNTEPGRTARMLRGREDEVMRLVATPEWKKLLAA